MKALSKLLLSIFVVVFSFPVSALGSPSPTQYMWEPPAGAPPYYNTPSPINVGPVGQNKDGAITFTDADGQEQISIDPNEGVRVSVPSLFFDPVGVGFYHPQLGSFPSTLRVYGQMFFQPASPEGDPIFPSGIPAGYVLKASEDGTGRISWEPGLPDGGNDGDILIWNEELNQWISGPNTSGDICEEGATCYFGDYIECDPAIQNCEGLAMPDGTPTYTMYYSDVTNKWEQTPLIRHFTDDPNKKLITIGNIRLDDNNHPTIPINWGFDGFQELRIQTADTRVISPAVTFISQDPSPSPYQGYNQNILFASNNITFQPIQFGDGLVDDQRVNLNTDVFFKPLSWWTQPAPGFVLTSADEDGRLTWADPADVFELPSGEDNKFMWFNPTVQLWEPQKNFSYTKEYVTSSGMTVGFGRLSLHNASANDFDEPVDGSGSIFVNEGLTALLDDVRIGQDGDLFLEGIDIPNLATNWGDVRHLCIRMSDRKVVACPGDLVISGDNVIKPLPHEDFAIFTPGSPEPRELVFPLSGLATIKYCGAAGGGGGGDYGSDSWGGGGGGGGGRGQCHTETRYVQAGDVLTMDIGIGGNGGNRGARMVINNTGDFSFNPNTSILTATDGQPGGLTRVFINGDQVGVNALGGFGGSAGHSQSGSPGFGGNAGGGEPAPAPTNNGKPGHQHNDSSCHACGGNGGDGMTDDFNMSIGLMDGSPSSKGHGGAHPSLDSSTGKDGSDGAVLGIVPNSFGEPTGGGGGGGSLGTAGYGLTLMGSQSYNRSLVSSYLGWLNSIFPLGQNQYNAIYSYAEALDLCSNNCSSPLVINIRKAGAGGRGGDGYVYVVYPVDEAPIESSHYALYTDPDAGEITVNLNDLVSINDFSNPVNPQMIIELWAGGGGGGGFNTNYSSQEPSGGGGGSGAYKKVIWNVPTPIPQNAQFKIKVGQGGSLGNTGGGGNVTSGGNGGISYVKGVNLGTTYLNNATCVHPGRGGGAAATSANGAGGLAPIPPSTVYDSSSNPCYVSGNTGGGTNGVEFTNGNAGDSGATGGNGGEAITGIDSAYGAGGKGSNNVCVGGICNAVPGTPGGHGAVKISW